LRVAVHNAVAGGLNETKSIVTPLATSC